MEYKESKDIKLEITIDKWINIIEGWKKRYLMIDSQYIHIVKSKTMSIKNNIESFDLKKVKVFDETKKNQICIQNYQKKIFCKFSNEEDKNMLIQVINICIYNLQNNKDHMELIENNKNDNNNNEVKDDDDEGNDLIVNKEEMMSLNEQIDKMTIMIFQLDKWRKYIDKKNQDNFNHSIDELAFTHKRLYENMKGILSKRHKDHSLHIDINKSELLKDNSFISVNKPNEDTNLIANANENNNDSNSEDEPEKEEINIKLSHEKIRKSIYIKNKFERSLSKKKNDFIDDNYTDIKRNSIPLQLKIPSTMISDIIKASAKSNTSLPIIFNEPISMLQKQCEKFFYTNLLTKASDLSIPIELKLCYITGFIVGELSQCINRFLKPFNPILGETFEYFDNERQYRYFAEQVSHKPPISAFICESSEFVVFGDTRYKSSYKILKGAMELEYTNKTQILFKNDNNLAFSYSKPKMFLKGIISKELQYDFGGRITIDCFSDSNIKAEIDFIEDAAKKDIYSIEGAIYKNNEIVYRLKGKWNKALYSYDKDYQNQKKIWEIYEEAYINNTFTQYTLPAYSLTFNTLPDTLKAILPQTDSRLRPDLRKYENGEIDSAEVLKKEIEANQRENHKAFEEATITYTPSYFQYNFDITSGNNIYIFNGQYFEDRKEQLYPKKNFIF